MKKFDMNFEEGEDIASGSDIEDTNEHFPTAVYTVYNVRGEPIGHKLYSYQPVYEPEEEDLVDHDENLEYESSRESIEESPPHMTVLKGGLFPDHDIYNLPTNKEGNINKLKHQYFERYVDRRRKRFLMQLSNDSNNDAKAKNVDIELQEAESKVNSEKSRINKDEKSSKNVRRKRDIKNEEISTEASAFKSTAESDITNLLVKKPDLSVIPIDNKVNTNISNSINETEKMLVIPLQNNKTNSTDVDNLLEKRDKRTSRKTDRLNQTTSTIPKT